ncbi:MAG: tetratricopeptide repeat protein [Bacteroidales bacterium]|nr:tetratricopeptide repeat protein [Bacteroidales bacterium]
MIRSILSFLLVTGMLIILSGCGGNSAEQKKGNEELPHDKLSELKLKSEQEPENPDIFNELALYYLGNDNFNDALHNINKSLELEPGNTRYFITLSDIYLMMGDADRAQLIMYKALDLEPNNAEIYVNIGRIQVYTADYTRAYENLRKALEIDSYNSKAYFWRGFAKLENRDTLAAINDWQLAVANDPESFDGYFQLGLLMAERNDRFAFDYLDHALRLAPSEPELLYDIGMALQEIQRFSKAIESYERILALDSCFYKAWFNIGYINLVELEEFNIAIEYFSKAVKCNPDYIEAVYNRGLAYEMLGQFDNARKEYRTALDARINYPNAIEGLNRLDQIQSVQ